MYQYTTFLPLASSKSYFPTTKDCRKQLLKVVEETNKYRASKEESRLSRQEIEDGQRLLKIDETLNPKVLQILGPEKEISLDNLKRIYLPDYKKVDRLAASLE